jgi:hypothetical protein
MEPSCLLSMVQVGGGGIPLSNLQMPSCKHGPTSLWNVSEIVESMPRRIQAVLEAKGFDPVLDGCT